MAIDQATEAGLDPGVLQGVAEPGDLADPLPGDLGAVADHVPGGLDLGRRDEAARQQPALQQVRQPLRVGVIFSELGNDLGSGRVRACLAGSGAVRVAGWVCAGAAGGFGEGGDAELDGLAAASDDLVHLGELGAGAGEADL